MMQCTVEYPGLPAVGKNEFCQASLVDEVIIKGFNRFILASELLPEDIITINDHVEDGTKAKTKVIRFNKQLITTMNDDFPYVEILHICDKEQ